MTDKDQKTIIELLASTRNPQAIHRIHGFRISDIRRVMREGMEALPGWGRLELQPWIIARKHWSWAGDDLACLQEHRRLHDQGRVTMCQGRDGDYIIQYAIPCQRPVPRTPYFYGAPA